MHCKEPGSSGEGGVGQVVDPVEDSGLGPQECLVETAGVSLSSHRGLVTGDLQSPSR